MPDAIDDLILRQIALKVARSALQSGARSDMMAALTLLPQTGKKAARLKSFKTTAVTPLELVLKVMP